MTRINLVDPSHLTDKHLMAEYRELPRIFTAVLKLQEQGKTPSDVDIPERYVLGKGHVKFFYNKISWLHHRFNTLVYELNKRNFNLDSELFSSIIDGAFRIGDNWRTGYKPSPEEIYLNMARICKRSKLDNVLEEMYD